MSRISDTTNYAETTPAGDDIVIGTDKSNTANHADGETVNFTIKSISQIAQINAQTGTTYTLALTDRGHPVTMDNASANTVTIPTNASVAFEVGSVILVIQKGAGATTITGDTGVTVNGVSAGSGDITAQYSAASLIKVATDTWIATGGIGDVA